MGEAIEITPSAARLTASLRDIGYSFVTALADIVDNSVTAGASRVEIAIRFHGRDSFVVISDNGSGMGPSALNEALRFGTRRSYRPGDLGRFGLGLKTASLSQARRLMVISRASRKNRRLHCRVLDIDRVERTELFRTFNMGLGMVLAVDETQVGSVMAQLAGETAVFEIGTLEARTDSKSPQVQIAGVTP